MESSEESASHVAYRSEHDLLGPIHVPNEALYGAHTARALEIYGHQERPVSRYPGFLRSYGLVKLACAMTNHEVGVLAPTLAGSVMAACREVIEGRWDDQFPVGALQGSGGVATNMNLNEVIANRASELLGGRRGSYQPVHPNDHVNRSQSTNDTYPTALSLAVLDAGGGVLAALSLLAEKFENKADEYANLTRLGRTCLRDALPLSGAQTHRAHAAVIRRGQARLEAALAALHEVPLGATAIGTGASAPEGYRARVVQVLAEQTGQPLRPAPDAFDALQHLDAFAHVAASVATTGASLQKIASDLRLLSSGPVGGLNEIVLPETQAGSSIMPGKTNPAVPEFVIQVALRLRGMSQVLDSVVAAGDLELNAMEPTVLVTLVPALWETEQMVRTFAEKCVAGLEWNRGVVSAHLDGSQLGKVLAASRDGYSAVTNRS